MEKDKRKVKFNVAIAKYRPGQIVDYCDMPIGHQFWVDNEDILETTRICEFIQEKIVEEKEINDDILYEEELLDDELELTQAVCPGKNKNGTACKSTKLMKNGYCFFHQDQAPAGFSGEMPDNLKETYETR